MAPAHLQALHDEVARQELEARSDNHQKHLRQERDRLEREVATATRKLFELDSDNMAEANAYLRDLKTRRDQAVAALDAAATAHPVRDL